MLYFTIVLKHAKLVNENDWISKVCLDQAGSTFCVVRATAVKFGWQAGNMKCNKKKCRMNKYMYNYTSVYNVTCVLVYTSYIIKFIDNRKSSQKCSSQLRLRCCNFWNVSKKLISNVIRVDVKKKHIISFQNCFCVLTWLSQGNG